MVGVVEYVYFEVFNRRRAGDNHRPNNRRGVPRNLDDANRGAGTFGGSALGVRRPPAGSRAPDPAPTSARTVAG